MAVSARQRVRTESGLKPPDATSCLLGSTQLPESSLMPIRSHDPFADVIAKIDPTKNPFVGKLVDAQTSGDLAVAYGPTLRQFPGHWRNQFTSVDGDRSQMPLVVEIGCHSGHTLTDMAKAHPETLFVGIDITFKRVINTAERAKELGLKNVFSILANAGGLDGLFAANEVNGFVTFFPDPWKKKKHAHNRLYAPKFCNAAWTILSPGGFLWLKTDQEPYFADACVHTADRGFHETAALPVLGEEDYSSSFMRRFQLKGLPWYGRKWIKPLS